MLSYQSARSGWKMILVVACGCLIESRPAEARPYRDARRGFALELPDGWRLSPAFGETEAMTFERPFSARRGGRVAALAIRAIGPEIDDARVQAELRRVWGDPQGRARPLPAAPAAAQLAWALQFKPAARVLGQAFLFRVRGARYLITLRASARDLARFREESAALLRSFRALSRPAPAARTSAARRPVARASEAGPPKAGSAARRPVARASEAGPPKAGARGGLAGYWVRPDGATLVLSASGEYTLADLKGRYRWQAGLLVLTRGDGGSTSFSVSRRGDRLVLTTPALPAPLMFDRWEPRRGLVGTWVADLPEGALVLVLGSGGRFELGAFKGEWSVEGDRLILRKSDTEVIAYAWDFSRDVLTLSGGDLDGPLRLTKRGR